MAIGVLILGESGTGKSFSMRNFEPDEVKVLSVEKPILPFRKKMEVVLTPNEKKIIKEMKNTDKKNIVVDDFQYVLGVQMMKRSLEKGWDKFNEIQYDYFSVLDAVKELPDDTIVYFISHTETSEDGMTKVKTIGKALDKYITIEGMFMIVLGTRVSDGKYFFTTQNDGKNTVKSPDGMFPSFAIENDLKYVEEKIRNYYYMDGAKSDEEIAESDEEKKADLPKEEPKKRRKSTREKKEDAEREQLEQDASEALAVESPKRRRKKAEERELVEAEAEEKGQTEEELKPIRKRRSKKAEESESDPNDADSTEPVDSKDQEIEEKPIKRTRRKRSE